MIIGSIGLTPSWIDLPTKNFGVLAVKGWDLRMKSEGSRMAGFASISEHRWLDRSLVNPSGESIEFDREGKNVPSLFGVRVCRNICNIRDAFRAD